MTRSDSDHISPALRARVASLLGREPRGLRGIPVCREDGDPRVIQVASLVGDKPFPTLFWLVDPDLNYAIDRLEAGGFIAELQADIDQRPALQDAMRMDHQRHIALRNRLMTAPDKERLRALGFYETLQIRGIGGIEKASRVRCLHTWYAAHLVEPNSIGERVDQHWASLP